MKKIFAMLLLGTLAAASRAELLFEEHFNYSTTNLLGETPLLGGTWTGVNITNNSVNLSGSLTSPAGFPAASGNKLQQGNKLTGESSSTFATNSGNGKIFLSYLIQINTNNNKSANLGGLSASAGAEYCQLQFSNVTGNAYYQLGLGGRSTTPLIGTMLTNQYAFGSTHLVVFCYERITGTSNDVMSFWIDPDQSTFGAGTEPAPVQTMTSLGMFTESSSFNGVDIKTSSSIPNNTYWDEIRVGTTWADVTTGSATPISCKLVFANTTPAQFIQKPSVTTNLAFVVRNDGSDATNVTVSLTDNYAWLTADTATNSIALVSSGSSVTNLFSVTIASNAPSGTYSDAFTLHMQGTGTDSVTSNFSAQISLQIVNTAFSSISKIAFAALTNGTDTATLTVSNESSAELSFILTNSPSAAWLSYPAGTLTLPANTVTNITVTTDGSLTAGPGQYSTVLAVTYLNNPSTPNPVNFSLTFDVSSAVSLLVNLSGDFNTGTGNINYVMPALTTSGETLIYDNDFGTAIVTNGALSSGGSYTGPNIYGSFRHAMTGGTAGSPPDAPTVVRLASTDGLYFYAKDSNTVAEVGLAATVDILYVFKKADFSNGLNTGSVGFDSSSFFSVDTPAYNANSKLLRAVVQNGSTWYISQASNTVASASANPKTIVTNASAAQWAVWDPLTSIDVATVPDFSTTVAGSTFTDIQAVGIYAHVAKTNLGTVIQIAFSNIKIGGVSAGAVSSYALTVNNGTGDGSYTNGQVQAIAADAPAFGYAFDKWTGDTQYVASVSSSNTTVTMPAQAVTVTATYIATEQYTTNGTPYSWLDQYGLTNHVADDVLDQDVDGLKTWQEYIAGTVPTNSASSFKAAQTTRNTVTWTPVITGRVYSVHWSTNLVQGFTALSTNIVHPQGSYTNMAPNSRVNHYQIKVRLP